MKTTRGASAPLLTGGTWRVIEKDASGNDAAFVMSSDSCIVVAHCYMNNANARLIAAAPDLLAACTSALSLLDLMSARAFPDERRVPIERQIAVLRAAIAKAKGGQS